MSIDLNALLLNLAGLTDEEVETLGRDQYKLLYARGNGRNSLQAFDGVEVVFFDDRFDHAFFSTTDRYRRPEAKNQIARDRVERIAWIGPILRGEVANSQCWELSPISGNNPRKNRLCIASSDLYVVWLEPLRGDRWKFSTAYVARAAQATEYKQRRRCVWKVEVAP